MKNNPRPIDKSKPSNKRCVNCVFWKKAKPITVIGWNTPERSCKESGREVYYWNRCPAFRWNPDKLYKEDGHE